MSTSIFAHSNSEHDQAIAFAVDEFIFAEAVERHMQCKHAMGIHDLSYSWRAIRDALEAQGLSFGTEVHVRTTWDAPGAIPRFFSALGATTPYRLGPHAQAAIAGNFLRVALFRYERTMLEDAFHRVAMMPRWKWLGHVGSHKIDISPTHHHLCHAANAAYTSPFEECVVVVLDGAGDTESVSFYRFANGEFKLLSRSSSERRSLGVLYSAVTHLCGFSSHDGEEWKVMGLAAYGEPDEKIIDFFRKRTHIKDLELSMTLDIWDGGWVDELEKITGPFRWPGDKEIVERAGRLACSFQLYFEETVIKLLRNAQRRGISDNLAMAGGCALNSSANGKILGATGFKALHVPSAPADDGNALGAVLYERYHERKVPRRPEVMSPYLGSEIPERDVEQLASFSGFKFVRTSGDQELVERTASILASGGIIGWCQGRAEFGPRALGNRSILADPRVADMREQINNRVKFREEYRPLAPSVLEEHGAEYFEDFQLSPYMERTLRFRDEVKSKVQGVVHRDGTGRLQTVNAKMNPLYYKLIEAFSAKTGVPMLLNTSFNVMGKPIVHSATDAMTVFTSTGLDALVIGRFIFEKPSV